MEIIECAIPNVKVPGSPWTQMLLAPISDLQEGSVGASGEKLKRHIDWVMQHPNPWLLGGGDYIDFMSPSNRALMRSVPLYDDSARNVEEAALTLADRFLALVRGTEGRWLGLVEGHHHYPLADGRTTDMYIADKLRAPFLGTSAFVGLRFKKNANTCTYIIACHHGQGGGNLPGAALNKVYQWAQGLKNAHMVLISHFTQMPTTAKDRLEACFAGRSPRIRSSAILFGCTGGWYQGYRQRSKVGRVPRGSYVEKGMMQPVTMGAPVYFIEPVHSERENYFEVTEMKKIRQV